jgi:hypothetical protein
MSTGMIPCNGLCTSCGAPNVVLLPIEPLFSLEEACCLVPARPSTLRTLLSRHRHLFPEKKFMGSKGKGRRLYTCDDIKTLRGLRVRSTR